MLYRLKEKKSISRTLFKLPNSLQHSTESLHRKLSEFVAKTLRKQSSCSDACEAEPEGLFRALEKKSLFV